MNLLIVPTLEDEIVKNAPSDVKVIDYRSFNDISMHPWIATTNWDCIEIVLGKGIIGGYIKQVLTVHHKIKAIILDEEILKEFDAVCMLMEIYPNIAVELRKAYMVDRNTVRDVLERNGILE